METYEKIRESGKEFEIVFVSADRSPDSFQDYHATMPWLSIPYDDDARAELPGRFDVQGRELYKETDKLLDVIK